MKNALLIVGLGALILAGGWWYLADMNTIETKNTMKQAEEEARDAEPLPAQQAPSASIGDENLVEFNCDGGRKMTVVFTREIVGLTLSDGRQMELRQAEIGSGVRYVNVGETIAFHGKGEGAFLVEGGATTYANCAAMI